MARQSSRLLRLVRWQYIRWGLVFPTFTLALWACNSHELQVPKPNPQQESDFSILVAPERSVDILFMIDNSPSMDPKQKALAKNFPKMIEALQKLEGGLPDVHIGVVSSDMGAGSGEAGGNCSVVLGNQGLLWGNDTNANPKDQNNKFATVKDYKDSAGDSGCGMNSGARWIEDIQNTNGVGRSQNYKGDLTDVFSCLASGVGVLGCGYEHQLQSIRVALNPMKDINTQNEGFLRRKAYLAVVMITDEDDCSADPDSKTNDGMFAPRTLGDTASLRCAARGHVCNGQPIPDYDPSKGYTGAEPFEADFGKCDAKDDGPDGRDYHKLPLIRIQEMVDIVNQVKDHPKDQILVSGIIGWPQGGKTDGVKYRIDKDSTSMPVEQQKLWDYMPICTVPDQKSDDGNIYKAYGGFRLKKFLESYKKEAETNLFSICSTDNFSEAMQQIGNAIVQRLKPGCVVYPLIDTDASDETVQPECQVLDKVVCDNPGKGDCLPSGYQEKRIKECLVKNSDGSTRLINPEKSNPQHQQDLDSIPEDERPCWYLVYDPDPASGCPGAFRNQRITALRPSGTAALPGTLLGMQCLTCASPPNELGESTCPALGTM